MNNIHDYLLGHQRAFAPARLRGLVQLNAQDFGGGDVGSDQERWQQLVEQASANVKAARLLDADWPAGTLEGADILLDEALSPKVPPPPPPPRPPQWADPRTYLRGWSAAAHWAGSREGRYASDWYAAELGTAFGWIAGGRTRGYGMVGPLFLPEGGHDCVIDPSVYRPTASGRLEVEWAPDDWREVPDGHIFLPANSTLWTLVLDITGGQEMVSFTHVLKEAKVGAQVAPFEPFSKHGDSGIEMFTARGQRASHIHLAAMVGGQQYGTWQGGMGNTPAWEYVLSKGFQIRQKTTVPSPQDYINGYVNREPY